MFKVSIDIETPCNPGSFFFLRIPGIGEKPFSPSAVNPLTFFVRSVGPFTRALEMLRPGETVFARGPYGKGFPEPNGKKLILIGGGTGIAPILMAALSWKDNVSHIYIGFSKRISNELENELRKYGPLDICIDEFGKVGEVIERLKSSIDSGDIAPDQCAYICGPSQMMESAFTVLRSCIPINNIFLAREDIMRCGIGICGSCATPSGLRSCVDGPVLHPGE